MLACSKPVSSLGHWGLACSLLPVPKARRAIAWESLRAGEEDAEGEAEEEEQPTKKEKKKGKKAYADIDVAALLAADEAAADAAEASPPPSGGPLLGRANKP